MRPKTVHLSKILRVMFACALAAAFLPALSAGAEKQIRANWSKNAPFASYKTYEWITNEATNHPFYRQYVAEYANYALTQKKGLQRVSAAQNPDLLATYHFTTQEVMDYNTFGYGFGPGWGGWGWGGWGWGGWGWGGWGWGGWGWGGPMYSQTMASPRIMGYLTLDLIDAHTRKIVWRGEAIQADVTKSGHAEEKQVANSIYDMLKRYPPKNRH